MSCVIFGAIFCYHLVGHPLHDEPRQNKAMKTTLTSNWRPLLPAFYPFLIAIAALGAMPRNARAQLYVTQGNIVSEFDAKTGAAINGNFITGLSIPFGLAVKGNTFFVANFGSGTIGEYDAKTGAAINPNFIAGLSFPFSDRVVGQHPLRAKQRHQHGW
jgi:hypothetical protein